MLETYGSYVLLIGAVLAVAAFFWLVVRAFRVSTAWGVGLLIFPLVAPVFIAKHRAESRGPARWLGAALVIVALPYIVSGIERLWPDPPFVQRVDGELRVTLTGVKDFDYATLPRWRDAAVLQMANDDVTDAMLDYLQKFDRLHKLDVSDSQITDVGLAKIAALPNLQELYLKRTKITDEGFRQHLAGKQSLTSIDFTGTEVAGKTKRDWQKQQPDVRKYVD